MQLGASGVSIRGVSILGASMNPSEDPSVPWILEQSKSRTAG